MRIPKRKWPEEWKGKYIDPVVPLNRPLYGHPYAGLCWEKYCTEAMEKCGFTKVPRWESMYVKYKDRLFLSIYVDDLLLTGAKENMDKTWKALRDPKLGGIELDPQQPAQGNVYLGCKMSACAVDKEVVKNKSKLWTSLLADKDNSSSDAVDMMKDNGQLKKAMQHRSDGDVSCNSTEAPSDGERSEISDYDDEESFPC